jgi:serine/threonine-protein kinase
LGLVHRDVSPPNILVSFSGTVKLADFGVAKVTGTEELDVERGLKGKFAFMAPEQVRGEDVDARTDVFAMSVLLYRLVTARYPFAGKDPAETLWQISSSITPRAPRALNESIPPRVEEVILKGLQKDPVDRFQSADEMLQALEKAVPPPLRGDSEDLIAELMAETLGERQEQRRRQTARAMLSVAPGPVDRATTPKASTLKGVTYSTAPAPALLTTSPAPPTLARSRAWRRWLAIGSLSAATSVASIYWFTLPHAQPTESAAAPGLDSPIGEEPVRAPVPRAPATAGTSTAKPSEPEAAEADAPAAVSKPAESSQPTASLAKPKRVRAPVRKTAAAPKKRTVKAASASDLKSPY